MKTSLISSMTSWLLVYTMSFSLFLSNQKMFYCSNQILDKFLLNCVEIYRLGYAEMIVRCLGFSDWSIERPPILVLQHCYKKIQYIKKYPKSFSHLSGYPPVEKYSGQCSHLNRVILSYFECFLYFPPALACLS